MAKRKNRPILIWSIVIVGIIILAIIGSGFLTTFLTIFPNPVTDLGVRVNFPFDGNKVTIHLEQSSTAENWNFWNSYRFQWGNGFIDCGDTRSCVELGTSAGTLNGLIDSFMNEAHVISKTATLNGQPVETIDIGSSAIEVSGFPQVSGQSTLIIDVEIEIKCQVGAESCSGNELQGCESQNKHFTWFGDQWDADITQRTNQGEVVGKCGVECLQDSDCLRIGTFCSNVICEDLPVTDISVYRFENNKCNLITIRSDEKTQIDFETIESCEENIIPSNNLFLIISIVVVILVLVGLIFLFIKIRKKK